MLTAFFALSFAESFSSTSFVTLSVSVASSFTFTVSSCTTSSFTFKSSAPATPLIEEDPINTNVAIATANLDILGCLSTNFELFNKIAATTDKTIKTILTGATVIIPILDNTTAMALKLKITGVPIFKKSEIISFFLTASEASFLIF